mgnify:CR=1 FL=1
MRDYKINRLQYIKDPMALALDLAKSCKDTKDVPVGCVIVDDNSKLISCARNSVIRNNDATAHAEILAIKSACNFIKSHRLSDYILYVTLEPCIMCEAAIHQSRIKKVFFGAYNQNFKLIQKNTKKKYHLSFGGSQYFGGFSEDKSLKLIKTFFKEKRS